jgi:uncharacterized membrane protein YoaK (UPF0700 family)
MISKLPRWVWTGAWVLASVAGFVNVIGFLGFEHQAITHLTGTTSMLAAAAAGFDSAATLHFAAVIGAFLIGCVLSGFIIRDSALQLGQRYGVALGLEAIFLAVAVPLLNRGSPWGMYFASCACGLQNAMATTYSGTVLRTTHLSGMFTDLGIFLGHALRGLPVDERRIKLCLLIIGGFLVGGIAGAAVYRVMGYEALFFPSGVAAIAASVYAVFKWRRRNR